MGGMALREITRPCFVFFQAVAVWSLLGFLWLFLPLFVVAHAMAFIEEPGSQPILALGNLWAAFVIGSLLLLWTWKMATWKE